MKTFLMALSMVLLAGCAAGGGDLVGSWSLDVAAMDPNSAKQPTAKALVQTVEFTGNGKYESFIKTSARDKGDSEEGTYVVSGSEITTTIEGRDNTFTYHIKDKKLVLEQDGETAIFRKQ